MRKAGIFTIASFIVGLPEENENMRKNYVDFALKLADSAVFLPFQPFPGTPMAKGAGEPEDWAVEYAARLTREFSQRPESVARLALATKEATVRGMLSRALLQNRLAKNIFDEQTASNVAKILLETPTINSRGEQMKESNYRV